MIASLLACALAAPLPVQSSELYVVSRPDVIVRITDWESPAPTYDFLFNLALPNIAFIGKGLEIDRQTGDLLVLGSAFSPGDSDVSTIYRVDKTAGTILESWDIPLPTLSGLDQRADGELFSLSSDNSIIRIDLATGSTTSTPLSTQIYDPAGLPFLFGVTLDEAGMLIVHEFASNERYSVHPADGTVTPSDTASTAILSLETDGGNDLILGTLGFGRGLELEDRTTGAISAMPGSMVVGRCYSLALAQGGDGIGTHPLCPSLPNSTGQGASLELTGTNELATNGLEFYSRQLPASSFGYFITGPNVTFQSVGSGLLCVGAPQYRYSNFPLNSGSDGVVRFEIDAFSIPSGGAVVPGRTDVFQYWFRDLGSTSNLSDAVAVTWQ
jgi:hypothetical protein